MKKSLLLISVIILFQFAKAQNTFPTSGNVGIGTLNPIWSLDVRGTNGNVDNRNFMVTYPGGGQLTNTQLSGLAHLYSELGLGWAALYAKQGNASYAAVFNGTTFFTNGNVGIGITNPTAKLYVAGGGRNGIKIDGTIDGASASKYLSLWQGTGGVGIDPIGTGLIYLGYDQSSDVMFGGSSANGVWKANGNVGIGTTTPDQKLSVAGTIHSQAVKVDMTGWSDYVFKPAYNLSSLENVKAFIDKNHHLPDMPSEKEVVKNGADVGEMLRLQQQKIEELTLYLIKKDKQIQALQKDVSKLKRRKSTQM